MGQAYDIALMGAQYRQRFAAQMALTHAKSALEHPDTSSALFEIHRRCALDHLAELAVAEEQIDELLKLSTADEIGLARFMAALSAQPSELKAA